MGRSRLVLVPCQPVLYYVVVELFGPQQACIRLPRYSSFLSGLVLDNLNNIMIMINFQFTLNRPSSGYFPCVGFYVFAEDTGTTRYCLLHSIKSQYIIQ